MRKRLLSTVLALCTALTLLPSAVSAADGPSATNNLYRQNYSNWSAPITSYLYENGSGGLTRVEYVPDSGYIVAEDYSSRFEFLRGRTIPMELDRWGGFFAGETCNFFVFGQTNREEDDQKEVVRVVKYSKEWERLGQASLKGANTTVPFDAGSLRFAEYEDELYIRTCHEMYTSNDGLNHQANLTLAVRESDMALLDSFYAVWNSSVGYVSHSFNQFVLVDRQRNIVTLDHGDAYPRSAVLMVYQTKAGQGKFSGLASNVTVQDFPGIIGANITGASVGGLAETAGGYAIAYNYDGLGSNYNTRSVYFAYVDKDTGKVTRNKLSSAGTRTPVLAPAGLDGGYILWNDSGLLWYDGDDEHTLYYAPYSDGGSVGEVRTADDAPLSDCQPIFYNGNVVWYTTRKEPTNGSIGVGTVNTPPTFYLLNESGVTAIPAAQSIDIPVASVALNKTALELSVGSSETLTATIEPSNATNKSVTWTSSDPSVATVSSGGVVTAAAAGTAAITVTTADGAKTAACEVTVIPEISGTPVRVPHGSVTPSGSYAEPGALVRLFASPDPGYRLSELKVTGPQGQAVSLDKTGSIYTFTMPGYDVSVTVIFERSYGA